MHPLIQAFQIFETFNPDFKTLCEHDIMVVCGVEHEEVSDGVKLLLSTLGFEPGSEFGDEGFSSYRWGSC